MTFRDQWPSSPSPTPSCRTEPRGAGDSGTPTGACTTSGAAPLLNWKTRLTELPGISGALSPATCTFSLSPGWKVTELSAGMVILAGCRSAAAVAAGAASAEAADADAEAEAAADTSAEAEPVASTDVVVFGWAGDRL